MASLPRTEVTRYPGPLALAAEGCALRIPTMGATSVIVVRLGEEQIVVKRGLSPSGIRAVAHQAQHMRQTGTLLGSAGPYPPILSQDSTGYSIPYYRQGTLHHHLARHSKPGIESHLIAAVNLLFELSLSQPNAPVVSANWITNQGQSRIRRLRKGLHGSLAQDFKSNCSPEAYRTIERLEFHLADPVSRFWDPVRRFPLGLGVHGDFSLRNIVLTGAHEYRFIDTRGGMRLRHNLPWWDPIMDLSNLVAFSCLIEPDFRDRNLLALGMSEAPGLCLTPNTLLHIAEQSHFFREWCKGDHNWRLRFDLCVAIRLLGSIGTQLLHAPRFPVERAVAVSELLASWCKEQGIADS